MRSSWGERQLATLPTPPFRIRVRRCTAFKKARAQGLSIFDYRERNPAGARRAAEDFEQLTKEVIAYEHERTDPDCHRLASRAP